MIIYAIDADTINECLSYNWDEGSIFMNGWEISGFVYFYILQQRYMIAAWKNMQVWVVKAQRKLMLWKQLQGGYKHATSFLKRESLAMCS